MNMEAGPKLLILQLGLYKKGVINCSILFSVIVLFVYSFSFCSVLAFN